MFAVIVDLYIKPGKMEAFMPLMEENARASFNEPGCHQFDVCRSDKDENLVLIYEIYGTADDFQTHLQTAHFMRFDAAVTDMVADKSVRTGPRVVKLP